MRKITLMLIALMAFLAISCNEDPNKSIASSESAPGSIEITLQTETTRTIIPEMPEPDSFDITLSGNGLSSSVTKTIHSEDESIVFEDLKPGTYTVTAEGKVDDLIVLRNKEPYEITVRPSEVSECHVILSLSTSGAGRIMVDITWDKDAIEGPLRDAIDNGSLGFLAWNEDEKKAFAGDDIQWVSDVSTGTYTYSALSAPATTGTEVTFRVYTMINGEAKRFATTFPTVVQVYENLTSIPDKNEIDNFHISEYEAYLDNVTDTSYRLSETSPETEIIVEWTNPVFSDDIYPLSIKLTLSDETGKPADPASVEVSSSAKITGNHTFSGLSKDHIYSIAFQVTSAAGYSDEETLITGARTKTPVTGIQIAGIEDSYVAGDSVEVGAVITPDNATYKGYTVVAEGAGVNGHTVHFTSFGDYTITVISEDNETIKSQATATVRLSKPENVNAEAADNGIMLTWSGSEGADHFIITRTPGFSSGSSVRADGAREYLDADVVSGTEYTYTVKASSEEGEKFDSDISDTVSFTTEPADITISIEDIARPEFSLELGNRYIVNGDEKSSFTVAVPSSVSGTAYSWKLNGKEISTESEVTISGATAGLRKTGDESRNTLMLAVTLNGRKYSTTDSFWSVSEDPGKITLTDAGNDNTVYYNSDDDHSEVISVSFANNPSYAPTIEWTSSDPEIISVYQDGTITALKDGSAEITATVISTGETDTITVKSHIQATELTLSEPLHDILIIKKNGVDVIDEYSALTLTAEATPANGIVTTDSILWESSDPEIATVNNGTLTLLKGGSVTITASIDGIEKSRDLEIIDFEAIKDGEGGNILGASITFSGTIGQRNHTVEITSGNENLSSSNLPWMTKWCFEDGSNGSGGEFGHTVSGSGFFGEIYRATNTDTKTVTILIYDNDRNIATLSFKSKP